MHRDRFAPPPSGGDCPIPPDGIAAARPAAAPALEPASHRRRNLLAGLASGSLLGLAGLAACGGGDGDTPAPAPPPPPPPPAAPPSLTTLLTGLDSPYGLAFLPGGAMLVTEKTGQLLRLSADGRRIDAEVSGVPTVVAEGQGGLLDVILSPGFASDPWIYLSYSEPGSTSATSGTAVARARLVNDKLEDFQVVFRQAPKTSGNGHYGCRLVFALDGALFISLGERQQGSPAQDLGTTLGKIVRINPDGSIPADNPGFSVTSLPGIWSYGHRNPQGVALHPVTGELWEVEHGPQGGDELNRIQKGGNYGWPLRSYGCEYGSPVGTACAIGGGTHAPDYIEPVSIWVPTSTAPSSLMFYTGAGFPEWQGDAFVSALAGKTVWRIVLDGDDEVSRDEPLGDIDQRVRIVRQGPDGWLYLLTDEGELIKVDR